MNGNSEKGDSGFDVPPDCDENSFTVEYIFDGALSVRQPERGYRYSLDSILLAYYARPERSQRLLDLGAGCGIVSLILARRHPDIVVYGIEIQPNLALAAHINVMENRLTDRIKVFCEDMKHARPSDFGGPVDMVVANPPFGKAGAGRLGPDRGKMGAKHEVFAELGDVLDAAARVLKVSGSLVIVYPAERLSDLLCFLRKAKLEPKWLKPIYPTENADANRVVLKAVKYGRPGLAIKAPLRVHKPDGCYCEDATKIFEL